MTDYTDHLDYMLKKQEKTLSLWDSVMLRGSTGSWSDFEKSVTVESDTDSSQQAESTEDKSTTDQNVHFKSPIKKPSYKMKKQRRFPKRRIDD